MQQKHFNFINETLLFSSPSFKLRALLKVSNFLKCQLRLLFFHLVSPPPPERFGKRFLIQRKVAFVLITILFNSADIAVLTLNPQMYSWANWQLPSYTPCQTLSYSEVHQYTYILLQIFIYFWILCHLNITVASRF